MITIICNIRTSDKDGKRLLTRKGEPYAVVLAGHGGNFCLFAKKGDEKAIALFEQLPTEGVVKLSNVAVYNSTVLLYGDTKVAVVK